MNTSQLECIIDCDPVLNGRIIGVFAADKLPRQLPRTPYGFIANTHIHTKPGQHWCAFFSDAKGRVEFFDTYGRTPNRNSHYFQQWIEMKAYSLQLNHVQIQGDHSLLCGLYCILFLHQRLLGYTFQDIINGFDVYALDSNDKYVADTMLHAYSHCIGNDHYNQTCSFFYKRCF
jgi:hypothetical protein